MNDSSIYTWSNIKQESGLHQSPLGEEILSIKCLHLFTVQVQHEEPGNMHPNFCCLDVSYIKIMQHAHTISDIRNIPSYC